MSTTQRTILFLVGCLGLRFFLSYLAKTGSDKTRRYIAYVALVIAFGFMSIWLFDLRKTGFEAGGKIWWNDIRPFHALMYGLFAFLVLFYNDQHAWAVLFTDTLAGLGAWSIHKGLL